MIEQPAIDVRLAEKALNRAPNAHGRTVENAAHPRLILVGNIIKGCQGREIERKRCLRGPKVAEAPETGQDSQPARVRVKAEHPPPLARREEKTPSLEGQNSYRARDGDDMNDFDGCA